MVVWNTFLAKHTGVLQTLFLSLTGILFVKVSQYRFSSKTTFSDFHLSHQQCHATLRITYIESTHLQKKLLLLLRFTASQGDWELGDMLLVVIYWPRT